MVQHLEQQDEMMIDILRQLELQHRKQVECLMRLVDQGASRSAELKPLP